MSLAIGTRLGPYQILAALGAGGMGEVYKARDSRLERVVAVKVLPAERVADPARKQRFIQEARAASALNHPNIVVIHDIAQDSGIDFLVMEYVPGKTLLQMIQRRGMGVNDTLKYAVQIADALATAHAAGIVHRDLKPSNIMVTGQGRVKVLDFGLAKLTEEAGFGADQPTRTVHTDPGTVVGSAGYMSPEQAEGKVVDARSDIFSFGAVMYEMITGVKAFQGDSRASIMAAVLKEEPRPSKDLAGELPRDLERIIVRCLRKDLARRSQSMAEIKLALEELKEESDSGTLRAATAPKSARSKRAYLFGAATVVVVLIAVAAAWILASRRDTGPPLYRLRQVTRDEGLTTNPALSPDGRLLAYASDRAGENNLNIWVQQVAGGDAIRLTHHRADDILPRFSSDGSQIAFERINDGIYVMPSLGGQERLLVKGGLMPAFSPDGKWIAYYMGYLGGREGSGLFVVSSTAGAPRKLEAGLATFCCPIWSPDSKHLLVKGSATGVGFGTDWFIVPVEGGRAVKIAAYFIDSSQQAGNILASPVAWLGNRLIYGGSPRSLNDWMPSAENIWQISIEPGTWAPRGKPQRLTAGSGEYPGPASLDGRIPFSTGTTSVSIHALPLDLRQGKVTGELVRIVQGGANTTYPTLTADGRKMVFASDRAGTYDIWMKDLTSGEETVLVGTPEEETRGVISPDGSQVAFHRLENGKSANYLWPLPAGPERKLCEGCGIPLNWTPDNKSVVIPEGEPFRLVALNVTTGQRTLLASHPKYPIHDGLLSPDGRWIVFKLVTSASVQPVFIAPVRDGLPVPEQDWIRITGDTYNYKPFWSPDGSLVYYYSQQDNFNCLYARRLDAASKHPQGDAFAVRHFHDAMRPGGGQIAGWGIGPDRLYIPMVTVRSNVWLAEPEKSQ